MKNIIIYPFIAALLIGFENCKAIEKDNEPDPQNKHIDGSTNDIERSFEIVEKMCFLGIKSIKRFEDAGLLIEHLTKVHRQMKIWGILDKPEWPGHKITDKAFYRCIGPDRQAILDLKTILSHRQDVCSPINIDKIVAYHDLHVAQLQENRLVQVLRYAFDRNRQDRKQSSGILQLFREYVRQVSVTCKLNMKDNIERFGNKFTDEDFKVVIPWFYDNGTNPHTLKARALRVEQDDSVKKLIDQFEISDPEERNDLENENSEFARTNAFNIFGEVHKIGDIVMLDQYSNYVSYEPEELAPTIYVNPSVHNQYLKIVSKCIEFEPYYSSIIMPIVRLAYKGYNVYIDHFDSAEKGDRILYKWYTMTQFCEAIFRVRMKRLEGKEHHDDTYILELDKNQREKTKLEEIDETIRKEEEREDFGSELLATENLNPLLVIESNRLTDDVPLIKFPQYNFVKPGIFSKFKRLARLMKNFMNNRPQIGNHSVMKIKYRDTNEEVDVKASDLIGLIEDYVNIEDGNVKHAPSYRRAKRAMIGICVLIVMGGLTKVLIKVLVLIAGLGMIFG